MPNFTHMKVQVVGKLAAEALRREAAATPKPGLVDRENSGAHRDMDYPLFLASADALEDYFAECAALGAQAADLQTLREAGLCGEKAMFAATGGVNTHKGMVFSMGILCFCLGQMTAESGVSMKEIDPKALQKRCGQLAADLLGQDDPSDTHGALVRKVSGIGGIRKEALSGFDTVFSVGYPALQKGLSKGLSLNFALVETLLKLMTVTEDSNAAHRGGEEGLAFLQKEAARILEAADLAAGKGLNMVREFDRECIRRNLSPGGSADLLAMSAMLHMVFE